MSSQIVPTSHYIEKIGWQWCVLMLSEFEERVVKVLTSCVVDHDMSARCRVIDGPPGTHPFQPPLPVYHQQQLGDLIPSR